MEYFDYKNGKYIDALKSPHIQYAMKIELLSKYETVIGDITQIISYDNGGQLNINRNQLVRRSCSLSVVNVDAKYIPSPISHFWYNRKFKLWIGVLAGDNTFWFSQGVFYCKSATGDAHRVNIEAIDKGGALNGDLKMNLLNVKTTFKSGSSIADVVRNVLVAPLMRYEDDDVIGGDNVIDCIAPIIDTYYETQKLMADIVIEQNSYIGKVLTDIADGYGANIYYDTNGRLCVTRQADIFFVDGYRRQSKLWDFNNINNANYSYNFDAVNAVTVYTDDTKEEYISYTAYNNNPLSPCNVGAIGLRRAESQQINYINVSAEEMKNRCKQYAILYLLQESMRGMSTNFNVPLMPHFDVDKTIGITDGSQGITNGTFVIQSLTLPLNNKPMEISATNIEWLPLDKLFATSPLEADDEDGISLASDNLDGIDGVLKHDSHSLPIDYENKISLRR